MLIGDYQGIMSQHILVKSIKRGFSKRGGPDGFANAMQMTNLCFVDGANNAANLRMTCEHLPVYLRIQCKDPFY